MPWSLNFNRKSSIDVGKKSPLKALSKPWSRVVRSRSLPSDLQLRGRTLLKTSRKPLSNLKCMATNQSIISAGEWALILYHRNRKDTTTKKTPTKKAAKSTTVRATKKASSAKKVVKTQLQRNLWPKRLLWRPLLQKQLQRDALDVQGGLLLLLLQPNKTLSQIRKSGREVQCLSLAYLNQSLKTTCTKEGDLWTKTT